MLNLIKKISLTNRIFVTAGELDGQQKQISRLTDKVMEQIDTIERLQEKASDLGRLDRHLGRKQVQPIVDDQRH